MKDCIAAASVVPFVVSESKNKRVISRERVGNGVAILMALGHREAEKARPSVDTIIHDIGNEITLSLDRASGYFSGV